ncbi:hypothetical protein ACERK3_12335 [Phycisphaerales bacterium AB-hyl4]|uniref:Secreted protein n=1 Tax=Natronomicrosphaera hydrolytica TaxID=3242702 RepID=A0ABV4U645_9BACT
MSKWMMRIAIRLGLVFAGFVVLFTVLAATGNQSLRQEVRQWRAAGLIDDHDAPHEVGEAYERWQRAVGALTNQRVIVRQLLEADEPTADQAGERLTTLAPLLTAVHGAAFAEGPVTQAGPDQPHRWGEQLRDRLHESRDLVMLLEAEAKLHAIRGDHAAASRAIEAGVTIANRMGAHGVWLAQIARLSLLERMLITLETVYAEGGLPGDGLRDRLLAIDLRQELAETFRAEGVHTLRLVSDTDPQTTAVNWSTRGWWYHDTAYLLEQYRECMAMLEDEALPMRALPVGEDDVQHPFWARTSRVVLPGVHASLGARLAVQMRLAMALTAIELREQAADGGALPKTLEGVAVPSVEPGVDRPIVYERDADGAGFALRSTDELVGEPVWWRW